MNYIYTSLDNQSNKKFTIFSIPKPFHGHIGIIQLNAIRSWTLLTPKPEIILFGNEAGTKEICQQLDLIHIPEINHNEYGTPLLNSVFATVHSQANRDIIAYINTDIILTDNFSQGIQSISEKLDNYLLIGRRWDIDKHQILEFKSSWKADLKKLIQDKGCLGDYDCKDYFVFPKKLFSNIPRFAIGRGYWDTWMVTEAIANGYPVVDGSLVITAIHQNHSYSHIRGGRNEAYMGREAEINKTIGNVSQPGNIACATWVLKPLSYRKKPQLSIIIIIQETSKIIEKALLSVLVQNYTNYEIIIVNHGCNNKIEKVFNKYRKSIRYYDIEKSKNIDPFAYGLNLAQGEFVLFLDKNKFLLPKALCQLMNQFNREASTLDILVSDCKTVKKENMTKSLSLNNYKNLESLHSETSENKAKIINKSIIIFRYERVKFLINYDFNFQKEIFDIIHRLIYLRGCRARHFKLVIGAVLLRPLAKGC